jgi:outer membrane murein-binding lipoprotein Lpp
MKRQAMMVLAAAVLLVGLSGCGASEREELKTKVASLEAQVAKLSGELATKDATLNELRVATDAAEQKAKQAQLQIDSVTAERDKLKTKLNALKKKKK